MEETKMQKRILYTILTIVLILIWAIGCGEGPTEENGDETFSVQAVFPTDGARGVPANTALLLKFSREVTRPSAEASITLSPSLIGEATYDAKTNVLLFKPKSELKPGTTYEVTVQGAETVDGNVVTPYSYSFTAGEKDTSGPRLSETVPANEDENVHRTEPITFRFDEALNPLTFYDSLQITPKPRSGKDEWEFEWSMDGKEVQVSFGQLGRMQTYQITLNSQKVTDLSDNALSKDVELQFTTHVGDDVENIDPNGSYSKLARYTIYRQSGGRWTVTWLPTRTNVVDNGAGTILATGGTMSDIQTVIQNAWEKTTHKISADDRQLDITADFYWGNPSVMFKTDAASLTFKNFKYNDVNVKPNEIWIGQKGAHPSSAKKFTLINSDLPTDQ